eukprot:g7892.t1
MASVPIADLSKEEQDELLCTYAALVLHDDGAEITPQNMTNLIKAAGCNVEGYWPLLMSKMISNVGMDTLIKLGSGRERSQVGCSRPGGGPAPAACEVRGQALQRREGGQSAGADDPASSRVLEVGGLAAQTEDFTEETCRELLSKLIQRAKRGSSLDQKAEAPPARMERGALCTGRVHTLARDSGALQTEWRGRVRAAEHAQKNLQRLMQQEAEAFEMQREQHTEELVELRLRVNALQRAKEASERYVEEEDRRRRRKKAIPTFQERNHRVVNSCVFAGQTRIRSYAAIMW